MIYALIPAHNEAGNIAAAIEGLNRQTVRPDQVTVVCDNCTDSTADIAARDAYVYVTDGNSDRKAGALNQALGELLHFLSDDDMILIQDADTVLSPTFVETAARVLRRHRVGAVGGIFLGEPGHGLLGQLQRNEYERYARSIYRKGGKATVLTGTATMFEARVLREVHAGRLSGRLPGKGYYNPGALTEDDCMTKAVKTLGYRTMSPRGCEVVTEVMTTIPDLWVQRLRWQRGALENIRAYGLTKVIMPYALKQLAMLFGGLFFWFYLTMITLSIAGHGLAFTPFWLGIGALFFAERLVTVRTWKGRLLAAAMLPEMALDLGLNLVSFTALFNSFTKRQSRWDRG